MNNKKYAFKNNYFGNYTTRGMFTHGKQKVFTHSLVECKD